jgi:hypothetical protein
MKYLFWKKRNIELMEEKKTVNYNIEWVNCRGTWITYLLLVLGARVFYGSIPSLSSDMAWTFTNLTHVLATFILLHWLKGTPFADKDQGEFRKLTLWEQIDYGRQFTPSKKFLTFVPIGLFLLSVHFSHFTISLFFINFLACLVVIIAKLPIMHKVRILGINKD